MGFSNILGCFKNSVSCLVLNLALGAALLSSEHVSMAMAEDITYDGSNPALLKNAPSFAFGYSNSLYAGSITAPSASHNNITVDYTGEVGMVVFGGLVKDGDSEGNKVFIKKGGASRVFGGYVNGNINGTFNVNGNSVHMSDGSVTYIYGGHGRGNINSLINVNDNSVYISGGFVEDVRGGYGYTNSGNLTVGGNNVVLDNGAVNYIYGGYGGSSGGSASTSSMMVNDNNAVVNNGIISREVAGGFAYGDSSGNISITVSGNSATINGGTVNGRVYGGLIYGYDRYQGAAMVNRNSVAITGGTVNDNVYGGAVNDISYSTAGYKTAIVIDNSVVISGGMVKGNVYGGYSDSNFYGSSEATTVNNNSVVISDSSVGNVYGGYGVGRHGDATTVSGNSVAIRDGAVNGNVYGGYGFNQTVGTNGSDITAINNTVTLEGDKIIIAHKDTNGNITQYGSIWGGYAAIDGTRVTEFNQVMSGNTLNLIGYRGTLSGIYNFENYNWTLPSNVVNGDTLIKIADGGTEVDLTNTKHSVSMYNDGSRLKNGDIVTMIDKTKAQTYNTTAHTITQGQFIIYEATLEQQKNADDNTAFVLKIGNKTEKDPDTPPTPTDPVTPPTNPEPPVVPTKPDEGSAAKLNPQSQSYLDGRSGALALLNQGIDSRRVMVRYNDDDHMPLIPFMIMNGSSQRYKTGSHIDMDSFNMSLGVATGFTTSANHLVTLGGFFEYGHGTYDSYNSFTNFASVYGDGDSNYKGGGIFGRVEFANTGLGRVSNLSKDQADGLYLEASLRAGRISSSFDIGNSASMLGKLVSDYRGSYKSKSGYYGGHVAGGYVFNFDDKQSLDIYGRYLWMHLNSDTVKIAYEPLHFNSTTSSRVQIGGRYSYAYNEQFKPYFGAAYEHEFDGDVNARAYEFKLAKPSLSGSTGIFEAGFSLLPVVANKGFNIDVNGQGYVGKRQGGGGGIKIKYQF